MTGLPGVRKTKNQVILRLYDRQKLSGGAVSNSGLTRVSCVSVKERFQYRTLAAHNFGERVLLAKPSCPVGFRVAFYHSRFRWPFHRKGVAREVFRIAISLQRPDGQVLAPILEERAQSLIGACDFKSGFFFELPLGGHQGVFTWIDDPFGNGPGRYVLSYPNRTAHVDEEHLRAASGSSVQKQACAMDRHDLSIIAVPCRKPSAPKVPQAWATLLVTASHPKTLPE